MEEELKKIQEILNSTALSSREYEELLRELLGDINDRLDAMELEKQQ